MVKIISFVIIQTLYAYKKSLDICSDFSNYRKQNLILKK